LVHKALKEQQEDKDKEEIQVPKDHKELKEQQVLKVVWAQLALKVPRDQEGRQGLKDHEDLKVLKVPKVHKDP
jgi:hypothetical protein